MFTRPMMSARRAAGPSSPMARVSAQDVVGVDLGANALEMRGERCAGGLADDSASADDGGLYG